MRPETAVLDIQGMCRVYTEFHRADAAEKTIILVNGSLATTASFAQTVRYLYPQYNVVLFDQPYAGKSKPHNYHEKPVTREMEAQVLLELIDHFNAEYVMSFSWGGASTLLALSQRPKRLEKAVISSFSPIINEPMRDYMTRGIKHLGEHSRYEVGHLVNDTIGKYLPSLFKRFNYRHISSLDLHEYDQMRFHVCNVMDTDPHSCTAETGKINVPVLFMNGALDEYTTPADARLFANHVKDCSFSTIEAAGHFLDMEHKNACEDMKNTLMGFLQPDTTSSSSTRYAYHQTQGAHAFAF